MALFVVNVEKYAYCEIEIEDQPMGPSANLISQITMHDGFGISTPTLAVYFQDQSGELQNSMNLVEGIKCTITLAKNAIKDKRIARSYSLWQVQREVTNDGPMLKAIFTLRVPKWSTSVYCEALTGTSSDVIGNLAASCGLRYEGPENSCDDSMTWINPHTTRANFTEDVAMRGYCGEASCMVRVLTMNSEVRYKDLFHLMTLDPEATFAMNTEADGKTKPIHFARETKMIGGSGLMSHWVNYGQTQYNHSLDSSGDWVIDGMNAPVFGPALPVNEKVRSELDAPARVNYTGFDPGTMPNDASNVHEHYEQALYQNVRGLALFSERIKLLTDNFTELNTLDVVEYVQKDASGPKDVDSLALNGKYIIVGKIINIKNGHNYAEIFDLMRSYVYSGKKTNTAGDGGGPTKGVANAGPVNLAEERAAELDARLNSQQSITPPTIERKDNVKPEADQLNALMDGLGEFNAAVPAIPEVPLGGPGSLDASSPEVVAQNKLATAIQDINKGNSDLKTAIAVPPDAFNPERSVTVKKISATAVETSANNTLNAVLANEGKTLDSPVAKGVGLNGLSADALADLNVPMEKQVLDRFTLDTGADPLQAIKSEPLKSAVSATTSASLSDGSFVTDPLRGGVFVQDFIDIGSIPPNIADMEPIDAVRSVANRGTNFTFPASQFGLSAEDALISPGAAIDYATDFVERTKDPVRFLLDEGAQKYADVFGSRMPQDAADVVQTIADKIPGLRNAFGANEIIAGDPESTAKQSGFTRAKNGVLRFGKNIGIEPDISINEYQVTGKIVDGIEGTKNDTGFSKMFNFRFGSSGVGPVVEKVVERERIESSDGVSAATDVITMNRDTLSWNSFARMGNNNSVQEAAANPNAPQPDSGNGYPDADYKQWSYPSSSSMATMREGSGSAFSFSDKKVR